jgi:hypothetical protein
MSTNDFSALAGAARTSMLGRALMRVTTAAEAALTTSRATALGARTRKRVQRIGAGDRHRYLGVTLMAASITHYVLSELQSAHQKPLAAFGVSLTLFVVGLALTVAGEAVLAARRTSRTRALWRRFITSEPS